MISKWAPLLMSILIFCVCMLLIFGGWERGLAWLVQALLVLAGVCPILLMLKSGKHTGARDRKEEAVVKGADARSALHCLIGLAESLLDDQVPGAGSSRTERLTVLLEKAFALAGYPGSPVSNHEKIAFPSQQQLDIRRYTILVGDDDPTALILIYEQLVSAGFVVVAVSNCEALLRILAGKGTGFDLVILSSGNLLGEIRRQYSSKELPVLLLSAHTGGVEGANACLTKPVPMSELLTHVHIQLTRRRGRSSAGKR